MNRKEEQNITQDAPRKERSFTEGEEAKRTEYLAGAGSFESPRSSEALEICDLILNLRLYFS